MNTSVLSTKSDNHINQIIVKLENSSYEASDLFWSRVTALQYTKHINLQPVNVAHKLFIFSQTRKWSDISKGQASLEYI